MVRENVRLDSGDHAVGVATQSSPIKLPEFTALEAGIFMDHDKHPSGVDRKTVGAMNA
jgi:hypothetical protein